MLFATLLMWIVFWKKIWFRIYLYFCSDLGQVQFRKKLTDSLSILLDRPWLLALACFHHHSLWTAPCVGWVIHTVKFSCYQVRPSNFSCMQAFCGQEHTTWTHWLCLSHTQKIIHRWFSKGKPHPASSLCYLYPLDLPWNISSQESFIPVWKFTLQDGTYSPISTFFTLTLFCRFSIMQLVQLCRVS